MSVVSDNDLGIQASFVFFFFPSQNFSKPLEPDRLFECLPNSMRPSSGSPGHNGDSSHKSPSNHHSEQPNGDAETAVFTPPTLIPPRILPLLHDLAQQMVQAGHQQQLQRIYR